MADNATIVRGIYDGLARGDIMAALGAMHERIEWNEAEHFTYWPGGAFIGPQAVPAGVLARIAQISTASASTSAASSPPATRSWSRHATRGRRKATGKAIDAQVAHVWDLREGEAVRFQQYTDTWHFAQATGVVPLERALA